MPRTEVLIFADKEGVPLVLKWMDQLPDKVQEKCIAFVQLLAASGHELRRPHSDYLRNGIYELRINRGGINYRLLYFFHEGRAVLSNGLKKEAEVPTLAIEHAIQNKLLFSKNPMKHTFRG
jgi:hypothetical protein